MSKKVSGKSKTAQVTAVNSSSKRVKDNSAQSSNSLVEDILHLQNTIGNQEVQRLVKSGKIQASSPAPTVSSGLEAGINSKKGGGQPLPESARSFFEPRFGADFSRVRLHTDTNAASTAKSLNAQAFTVGRNVFFGSGYYSPGTSSGKRLLAHELSHTLQQDEKIKKSLIRRKVTMHSFSWSGLAPVVNVKTWTDADVNTFVSNIGVGNHTFDDIIEATGKEYDFVGGATHAKRKDYRKRLIISIIKDMHKSSDYLLYKSDNERDTEIRKRAVLSLDMRASQGKTRGNKPTGYPPSTASSWAAVASTDARPYWTVTIISGDYNFTLSALGKNNAYTALMKLIFSHKTRKRDRTLMHCDYLVSAMHYKVMAEAMGTANFDNQVKTGNIRIKLQDLSISNIIQKDTESKPNKSLSEVQLNSENDLIIGDHVIFYNHPAYNDLNKVIGQSWRLENAIIIDNEGPGNTKRFQGHGYFKPKTRAEFIDDMKSKFNNLVRRAKRYINANNIAALNRYFSFSRGGGTFKSIDYTLVGGRIRNPKIKYQEGGTNKEISPLRYLNPSDYPKPFVKWGKTKITVWRPMESRPNF